VLLEILRLCLVRGSKWIGIGSTHVWFGVYMGCVQSGEEYLFNTQVYLIPPKWADHSTPLGWCYSSVPVGVVERLVAARERCEAR